MQKFFLFLLCVFYFTGFSQSGETSDNNVNAVIQHYNLDIQILNQKKYTYKEKYIILVKNQQGNNVVNLYAHHDKATKVKHIEAKVHNAEGKELKSVRRKDFKDISVGDGFSVFNDNRVLYYDYTPTVYPYIITIEKEIESSNTAFLPVWQPQPGYYTAVTNASLSVSFPENLGFRYKKYNFSEENMQEEYGSGSLKINLKNLKAFKYEDRSISYRNIMPRVRMALDYFHLEGVDGQASSWEEFGKWYYDKLLKETQELPESAKAKVKELTQNVAEPLEKARIVYEYMQGKTRYVSVQVGIGGWKPMYVKDVDKLGYGDCKALTNYTKSLLDAAGVNSYYTIVHAESDYPVDFDDDFVSMQGNHVILAIPHENDYVWLECTSQTQAFGFQGSFTDNRKVLLIKDDKGEIVKTKAWVNENNFQHTTAKVFIDNNDVINLEGEVMSYGLFYDSRANFERLSNDKKDEYYKERLRSLNGLKIQRLDLVNDKIQQKFTEKIELNVSKHIKKMGQDYVFAANMLSNTVNIPRKYKTRENNFVVYRGYKEQDRIEIEIPENSEWVFMPQEIKLDSKFGSYEASFEKVNNQKIIYYRKYLLNKGVYESGEYEAFRTFIEEVNKSDQAKLIYKHINKH